MTRISPTTSPGIISISVATNGVLYVAERLVPVLVRSFGIVQTSQSTPGPVAAAAARIAALLLRRLADAAKAAGVVNHQSVAAPKHVDVASHPAVDVVVVPRAIDVASAEVQND